MDTEQLTILHCAGGFRAHKIHRPEVSISYDAGSFFTFELKEVRDLAEFAELLRELEYNPAAFLIRGAPQYPSTQMRVRKRYRGDEAAFKPQATSLFCIDFDSVVAPEGMDPTSRLAVAFVISQLPKEFHSSSCVAQFSNSAGLEKSGRKIKLHLWFWGVRPYEDKELRRWAACSRVADAALYNPVQPHFTARPLFEGLDDPFALKERIHFIQGTTETVAINLPALSDYSAHPREISESERHSLELSEEGKVIDGRELLLRDIRWFVLCKSQCKSAEDFASTVWASFSAKAETGRTSASDNTYEKERVVEICDRDWQNHGAIVPASAVIPLEPEAASALLESSLRSALSEKGVTAIKATAGLGKTTLAARLLLEQPDIETKFVDIYAPSKKEQQHWQTVLQREAERLGKDTAILVIEGRNPDNCVQHEAAKLLSAAGLPATAHLCRTSQIQCQAFEICTYRQQFKSKAAAIRIYSHSHLATPNPLEMPKSDITIIDESFHNATTSIVEGIDTENVRQLTGAQLGRLLFGPNDQRPRLNDLRATAAAVADSIESGRPLLDELRARGVDTSLLESAAEATLSLLGRPNVGPRSGLNAISLELNRTKIKHGRLIASVFRCLAVEIQFGRSEAHSVASLPDKKFTYCSRKSLAKRCDVETVIVLDADCDETILRAHFPAVKMVQIDARLNAEIIQVEDLSFSKSYLGLAEGKEPNLPLIDKLASEIRKQRGRKLVVTYQSLIPFLEPKLPGVAFAYFGNLRGTNEFENCEVVFVIGRHFIPSEAVENAGRALFWDAAEPLKFGTPVPRRYAVGKGVLRSYDELDYRLLAIRNASRSAETRQGLGRLRPVHAKERKTVYLFSSQPVGVPVDALIQFEPPRAVMMLRALDGFLPFSSADLPRLLPSEFRDDKAARRWRDRPETTPEGIRNLFMRAGVVLAATTYSRSGHRGPRSNLLVDPLAHPMPHLSLARRLSPPGHPPADVAPLAWEEWDKPDAPSWLACYRLRKTPAEGV